MLPPRAMSSRSPSSRAPSEPPSQARIAEARRQGKGPRAPLASFAAATLGGALLLAWLGPRAATTLQAMLRRAVTTPALPLETWLAEVWSMLLAPLGLTLLGVACAMVLSRAVAQGFVFSVRALSPSKRFAATKSVRPFLVPLALFALGGVLLGSLPSVLRADAASWSELTLRFLLRVGVVAALLALLEASLSRAAFVRSLWMTRDERRREEREEQGSPEMRAARARARREARP